ncbi:hypothetical protein ACVW0J_006443 [Bradyrhizobium sp. i1.7.7]
MSKKSRKKSSKTPSGIATAKKKTPTKRGNDSNKVRENTADAGEQINQDRSKSRIT